MEKRYFDNPYDDYTEGPVLVDNGKVISLITKYVETILQNTKPANEQRADLYVGDAGIAFMFLRLAQCPIIPTDLNALEHAYQYIRNAKRNARNTRSKSDKCAFLCGTAGVYAVSAVISAKLKRTDDLKDDIHSFKQGFEVCKPINFSKYGSDEVLVGRAGYLSGIYWLNEQIKPAPIEINKIIELCEAIVESGRQYSKVNRSPLPLMYQYHGTEYLGAAHGVCAIYHMLLESPWFKQDESGHFSYITKSNMADIKNSIDAFVALQEDDGNFPVALESTKNRRRDKRLVHWCHGAAGAIFVLAKAYRLFEEKRYLYACKLAAELVWQKGLLYKGPGICHGVAGNGYVFLVMYSLTKEDKYLYRAIKFMDFLCDEQFTKEATTPDRPFSLYEGLAGTVCFLVNLLEPDKVTFPFMSI